MGSRSRRKIEVAIVAGLAGIVAALVWRSYLGPSPYRSTETPADLVTIRRDLESLERAVIAYARRTERMPDSLSELVPADIPAVPRDPYGRAYVLRSGGPSKVFLWCLGADGRLDRYPPDVAAIVTMDEVRERR